MKCKRGAKTDKIMKNLKKNDKQKQQRKNTFRISKGETNVFSFAYVGQII